MYSIEKTMCRDFDGQADGPLETTAVPDTLEVTPEAYSRLAAWGLSQETIAALCQLVGQYKYDCAADVINNMVSRGAYIDPEGRVLFPDSFSDDPGDPNGDCQEIACKLYGEMYDTGWIDKAYRDTEVHQKPGLYPTYVTGRVAEFFTAPASHHWICIGQEGAPLEDVVVLDGSFGKISTLQPSGYQLDDYFMDTTIRIPTTHQYPLGTIHNLNGTNCYANVGPIVGLSKTRTILISPEFIESGEEIIPMIVAMDGKFRTTRCFMGPDGRPCWVKNGGAALGAADRQEVSMLAQQLDEISIEPISSARAAWFLKKTVAIDLHF